MRYLVALLAVVFSNFFLMVLYPLTFFAVTFLTSLFTSVRITGPQFGVGSFSFTFIDACVAVLAYVLLAVLLLTTSGLSFEQGLTLFFLGSFFHFLLNVLRIEFLIFVALMFGKNLFNTLHLFLWKLVSSVFVAGIWFFLVSYFAIEGIPVYSDWIFLYRKLHRRGSR